MKSALLRYRVLAYLVGVMLLVLVFVAVPLHYLRDSPGLSQIVSPIHGFLFFVYVLVTFDLSRYTKWSLPRTLLIMISGTIPFMSFVMEHKVNAEVTAELAAEPGGFADSDAVYVATLTAVCREAALSGIERELEEAAQIDVRFGRVVDRSDVESFVRRVRATPSAAHALLHDLSELDRDRAQTSAGRLVKLLASLRADAIGNRLLGFEEGGPLVESLSLRTSMAADGVLRDLAIEPFELIPHRDPGSSAEIAKENPHRQCDQLAARGSIRVAAEALDSSAGELTEETGMAASVAVVILTSWIRSRERASQHAADLG